jgi:hypothetical protein
MRRKFPWVAIGVVVLVLAAVVWLGGDWLWHLLLRMHGIEGRH